MQYYCEERVYSFANVSIRTSVIIVDKISKEKF